MNKQIKFNQNLTEGHPQSWRVATCTIRDAAARLVAGNEAKSKHPANKPLESTPLERMGLRAIDFGVAKLVKGNAAAESIAGAGAIRPANMSPERCRGIPTPDRTCTQASELIDHLKSIQPASNGR
jgi:hypothetical protein